MKPISFVIILFITLSCNNNDDFYFGTWELNKEIGASTIIINRDSTLSWSIHNFQFLDKEKFTTPLFSPQKITFKIGDAKNCTMFTFYKLSDNQCIGCNYKCWIDENMIDEVFVARKDQYPEGQIEKPDEEVIILPKDYEGDFFIVYHYSADNQSKKIKINDKGIGINQGEPDLRQLYNANRSFRFEGQEKNLTIANPNGYQEYLNPKIDSIFKYEEVIVIQQGINQTGRADWNREHDEKVSNNLNIEYFEVRWMKE